VSLALIALLALAACGREGEDPEALAKGITQLSKGKASIRRHQIKATGLDYSSSEAMEELTARHVKVSSTIEGWYVTLDKWICADPKAGQQCGGGQGLPITYVIDESKVETGAIGISAPDDARGEAGYRVGFSCIKARGSCLDARIGAFGGYTPCKERRCGLAESETENAALALARTIASLGTQSIECQGRKACERVAHDFRKLIDLAAGRTFIEGAADLEEAVGRIARAADGARFIEMPVNGTTVVIAGNSAQTGVKRAAYRTESIRLNPDGRLDIELAVCAEATEEACADESVWMTKISHVALSAMDASGVSVHSYDRVTVRGRTTKYEGLAVFAGCRGGGSGCIANAGIRASPLAPFFPCKDEKSCRAARADFAGIASFASTPAFADWIGANRNEMPAAEATRSKTANAGAGPAGGEAGSAASSLSALQQAMAGAEIYLPASGRDVARLMRGVDVGRDDSGRLRVRRQVCLALLRAGESRGNECSVDTLFQDYDLTIDLVAVDAGSVEAAAGVGGNAARGIWVTAACKPGTACASLSRPTRPQFRALEFDTVMTGFGETVEAPAIRIPCIDEVACRKASDALRSLAKSATPEKEGGTSARTSPGVDPRFIGRWTLSVPQRTSWTWEFRADGTYVFVNDQTSFQGTYEAGNGTWSQKAANFSSADSGTYRFRDADTLELIGRLGTSVWKRDK